IAAFENANPVGTGMFYYIDDKVDEYVRLGANKEYWGTPVTGFDELMFVNFSDNDAMFQALQAGDIDYCTITTTQLEAAENSEGVTAHRFNQSGWREIGFNCWQDPASKGNPLILDKVIRQAIDYSINYQTIIDYYKGGIALTEKCLLPATHGKYHVTFDENHPLYRPYDPEAGKALLEANGYKDTDGDGIRESADGAPLAFRMAVIEENAREMGLLVESDIEKIGIDIEIIWVDGARMNEIIYDQNFDTDIYIWGWDLGPDDPSYTLSIMITDNIGGRSDCNYSNPYYDELYVKQAQTLDEEERVKIVHEMLEIIYEDVPYIIAYGDIGLEAYASGWTGWQTQWEDSGYWNRFSWPTMKLA
ncbi:MAG: ABC transporter substrate-binding protein, partial [Clostridia bacterium]|nr:ABC transporter substrate-binding protein [Clostridia bacterium]